MRRRRRHKTRILYANSSTAGRSRVVGAIEVRGGLRGGVRSGTFAKNNDLRRWWQCVYIPLLITGPSDFSGYFPLPAQNTNKTSLTPTSLLLYCARRPSEQSNFFSTENLNTRPHAVASAILYNYVIFGYTGRFDDRPYCFL